MTTTIKSRFLCRKVTPRFLQLLLECFTSIIFGLILFLLLYGRFSLYVSNVDWIYKGNYGIDVLFHQIGWEWFRQEPWHFPLGQIDSYGYPFGTNIIFTDSIPLFAIPLKFLSPWLGDRFQYLGLWQLVSIIGQILAGLLILREFTHSYPQKILGSMLLVLSPPLILRAFNQDSLTAQWILLVAIWFIFLEYRRRLWRGAWIVLFAVAMLVHLYIVAMLFPLWAIGLFFRYKGRKKLWGLIVDVITVAVVMFIIGYITGIFSLGVNNLQSGSFGYYTWNLNGFINPSFGSTFLNKMKLASDGQHEGFSYLGLGNLLILPFALYLFLRKDNSRRRFNFFLPLGLVALLLSVFALSQKAFIGARPLWEIQLPSSLITVFSLFRASGRFIWPVFYFLVLFGLISLIRNFRFPTLVLLLALVLQFWDLQPMIQAIKFHGFVHYQSPLKADFWLQAAKANRHIMLIPASNDVYKIYEPFALFARQNKLTLNTGDFARARYDAIENYGKQAWENLRAGRADPQTIYVIWDPDSIGYNREYLSIPMHICQVDGYDLILSIDNPIAQTSFDLSRYCFTGTHARVIVTRHVRDDYDGDGKTDPVKFDPATDLVWWLKSRIGLWEEKWLGSDAFSFVSSSDFDGDGRTDLAKFIPSTGTIWWLKSSTGTWDGKWLGSDTFNYVSGSDFDGDGKTDPAKFVPSTSTVWWIRSSDGKLDGKWLGSDTFSYVSGSDFDGDGKTDPAKFVAATGTVWWFRSSDGNVDGQWLGSEIFTYVSGSDFDGDGKTDPAKFVPTTGTVWWIRSSDGKLDGQWLGSETFTYVSGSDFDGDGKTDPAKFVAATHTLSWLNVSTGIWTNIDMGTGTYNLANGQ